MDELLAVLRPQLERMASRYADPQRASESTSDLVQEAWLRAWQRIDQFSGAAEGEDTERMFRVWVDRIVQTVGLNARRDRNRKRRHPGRAVLPLGPTAESGASEGPRAIDPEARDPSPSSLVRREDEAEAVQKAIGGLSDPLDRAILEGRFFEGVTLQTMAQRLSLTYEQVKYRYQNCMRLLERKLGRFL